MENISCDENDLGEIRSFSDSFPLPQQVNPHKVNEIPKIGKDLPKHDQVTKTECIEKIHTSAQKPNPIDGLFNLSGIRSESIHKPMRGIVAGNLEGFHTSSLFEKIANIDNEIKKNDKDYLNQEKALKKCYICNHEFEERNSSNRKSPSRHSTLQFPKKLREQDSGIRSRESLTKDNVIFPCLCNRKSHRFCFLNQWKKSQEFPLQCKICKAQFAFFGVFSRFSPRNIRSNLLLTSFLFMLGTMLVILFQWIIEEYIDTDRISSKALKIFVVLIFIFSLLAIVCSLVYLLLAKCLHPEFKDLGIHCKQNEIKLHIDPSVAQKLVTQFITKNRHQHEEVKFEQETAEKAKSQKNMDVTKDKSSASGMKNIMGLNYKGPSHEKGENIAVFYGSVDSGASILQELSRKENLLEHQHIILIPIKEEENENKENITSAENLDLPAFVGTHKLNVQSTPFKLASNIKGQVQNQIKQHSTDCKRSCTEPAVNSGLAPKVDLSSPVKTLI